VCGYRTHTATAENPLTGAASAEPSPTTTDAEGGSIFVKVGRYRGRPCRTIPVGISVTEVQTRRKRLAWGEVALPLARRLGGGA
jgi:hypothetical protein